MSDEVSIEVEEEEREVIDYVSLGKKMREIRKSKGKTQDDIKGILPDCYRYDRSVYSKYESGKVRPSRDFINKFSEYFHVPVDELLKKVSVAIPDTCALLKNKRLLHMLLEDYDRVIVPSTVLNELSFRKNRGKDDREKKIAWQILANIDYYMTEYSDRFKKADSDGYRVHAEDRNTENDLKIIELAKDMAKKVVGDVDIITDDVDITTFTDIGIQAVRSVRIDDYVAKRTKTFDYQTVLDLNLEYDHLEYYQKIISHIDLNAYLPDGMTLLISCIQNIRPDKDKRPIPKEKIYKKIRFLLDNGADPNKNDNGRYCLPPLAHCVQVEDPFDSVAFNILLDHHCDFNKASRDERTSSYMKVGKLNEGNTPLMIACWCGKKKFAETLCRLEGISLNQQDSNGYTALIKCAVQRHNRKKTGQKYSSNEYLYKYLIDRGADTLIRDRNNRTAEDWWNMADELD